MYKTINNVQFLDHNFTKEEVENRINIESNFPHIRTRLSNCGVICFPTELDNIPDGYYPSLPYYHQLSDKRMKASPSYADTIVYNGMTYTFNPIRGWNYCSRFPTYWQEPEYEYLPKEAEFLIPLTGLPCFICQNKDTGFHKFYSSEVKMFNDYKKPIVSPMFGNPLPEDSYGVYLCCEKHRFGKRGG